MTPKQTRSAPAINRDLDELLNLIQSVSFADDPEERRTAINTVREFVQNHQQEHPKCDWAVHWDMMGQVETVTIQLAQVAEDRDLAEQARRVFSGASAFAYHWVLSRKVNSPYAQDRGRQEEMAEAKLETFESALQAFAELRRSVGALPPQDQLAGSIERDDLDTAVAAPEQGTPEPLSLGYGTTPSHSDVAHGNAHMTSDLLDNSDNLSIPETASPGPGSRAKDTGYGSDVSTASPTPDPGAIHSDMIGPSSSIETVSPGLDVDTIGLENISTQATPSRSNFETPWPVRVTGTADHEVVSIQDSQSGSEVEEQDPLSHDDNIDDDDEDLDAHVQVPTTVNTAMVNTAMVDTAMVNTALVNTAVVNTAAQSNRNTSRQSVRQLQEQLTTPLETEEEPFPSSEVLAANVEGELDLRGQLSAWNARYTSRD